LFYFTIITGFLGPILAFRTYPELFAFKIFFLLHALAFLAYFLRRRKIEIPIHIRGYFIFFAGWLGWAFLSLLWVDNFADAFRHLTFLLGMTSFIFFFSFYLKEEKEMVKIYRIIFLILVGFSLLGVIETLTGWHLRTSVVGTYNQAYKLNRPSAVFWNPNDFSTYLSLYLPFTLGLMKYKKGLFNKIIGCLLYCSGLYLVILAESRANVLAILLGLLVFLVLNWKSESKKTMKTLVILLLIGIVIIGLLVSLDPELPFWVKTKTVFAQIYGLPQELKEDRGSAYVRGRLIIYGLRELGRHYLMGVGVGNAEQHMAKYGEDLGGIVNLHNWWLEVLVNYGLIIFLAYLHFYLSLVKDLLKVIRNSGILRLKMMAEVLTVSLASFSIACIGPSSLLPQRYMWFLFALALAVLNYAKEDISLREEGGRKN